MVNKKRIVIDYFSGFAGGGYETNGVGRSGTGSWTHTCASRQRRHAMRRNRSVFPIIFIRQVTLLGRYFHQFIIRKGHLRQQGKAKCAFTLNRANLQQITEIHNPSPLKNPKKITLSPSFRYYSATSTHAKSRSRKEKIKKKRERYSS